jgi:uncharacterized repeat protein (TIGR03843 family)
VPGHERSPQAADLIPSALAHGTMEVLGLMPNASNYTFLARCVADGDEVLAIYKPQRGEIPLWDFPDGTLHRREVAAFVVANALGWPNVPPTVLRDGPEGPGSAQLFVAFDPDHHYFTLELQREDDFRRVALFDLIVNNADRKGGHCLLGEDGRIWAIDHGVCFHQEPKLRTVIWGFAGEPLPHDLCGALADLDRDLAEGGGAGSELTVLLGVEETQATRRRVRRLLDRPVFPGPAPGSRPFPWPPV